MNCHSLFWNHLTKMHRKNMYLYMISFFFPFLIYPDDYTYAPIMDFKDSRLFLTFLSVLFFTITGYVGVIPPQTAPPPRTISTLPLHLVLERDVRVVYLLHIWTVACSFAYYSFQTFCYWTFTSSGFFYLIAFLSDVFGWDWFTCWFSFFSRLVHL